MMIIQFYPYSYYIHLLEFYYSTIFISIGTDFIKHTSVAQNLGYQPIEIKISDFCLISYFYLSIDHDIRKLKLGIEVIYVLQYFVLYLIDVILLPLEMHRELLGFVNYINLQKQYKYISEYCSHLYCIMHAWSQVLLKKIKVRN